MKNVLVIKTCIFALFIVQSNIATSGELLSIGALFGQTEAEISSTIGPQHITANAKKKNSGHKIWAVVEPPLPLVPNVYVSLRASKATTNIVLYDKRQDITLNQKETNIGLYWNALDTNAIKLAGGLYSLVSHELSLTSESGTIFKNKDLEFDATANSGFMAIARAHIPFSPGYLGIQYFHGLGDSSKSTTKSTIHLLGRYELAFGIGLELSHITDRYSLRFKDVKKPGHTTLKTLYLGGYWML